jgi:DNA repair protein RadC
MSNHNLFIHGADGAAGQAYNEESLAAARQVLGHRVRRGTLLQSPEKVGEYLTTRLGHLDYECFGLILVDLCGAPGYVVLRAFNIEFVDRGCRGTQH